MKKPFQGGHTVQPPQQINQYDQWRIALNLPMVEYVIPKSKAIKQQSN